MGKKHKHQVALTFAFLFGGLHVLWAALVLLGLAQPLVDFVMWAHMVESDTMIQSFNATAAITLIIVASAVGYAIGYVGATVWHRVRA